MKIVVFGARGRTGACVMKLSGGHDLFAFDGDVLDANAVGNAIQGMDAVVSVIGHVKNSPRDVQTRGMRNILLAMRQYGVRRIVSLTGTGVRSPGDFVTLIDKIMTVAIRVVDPSRVQDGINHAKVLQEAGLDYTIIRVSKLTDGIPTTHWRLSPHGPAKIFISRMDVAQAIIQVLEQGTFIREMPIISP